MTLSFASPSEPSVPLHVISQPDLDNWLQDQPSHIASWVEANGFTGAMGQALLIPQSDGAPEMALAGYGNSNKRARKRFPLAAAAEALRKGTYHIASGLPADAISNECLGWLLTGYAFNRYANQSPAKARLVAPEDVDAARIEALANAEALTRDLVNTPASDMGPGQLQATAEDLAQEFGAACSTIQDNALLDQNFPLIHTVGRAAAASSALDRDDMGRHRAQTDPCRQGCVL